MVKKANKIEIKNKYNVQKEFNIKGKTKKINSEQKKRR